MKETLRKIFKLLTLIVTFSITVNINSQELIPLKVNNEWKYIEKETINGNTTITDTIKSKIEKIVTYNNKKWFYMNELGDKYIVRNDQQGQYELDTLETQKNGDFKEVLMFKNSDKDQKISYKAYGNIKIEKEIGTTKIKTKIGEFDCIKYLLIPQEAKPNEVIEFFFSPGIGLVYHKWIENNIITSYELIEYNVK